MKKLIGLLLLLSCSAALQAQVNVKMTGCSGDIQVVMDTGCSHFLVVWDSGTMTNGQQVTIPSGAFDTSQVATNCQPVTRTWIRDPNNGGSLDFPVGHGASGSVTNACGNFQGCVTNTVTFKWVVQNNDIQSRVYQVKQNGVELCNVYVVLDPGQTGTLIANMPYSTCSSSGSAQTNGLALYQQPFYNQGAGPTFGGYTGCTYIQGGQPSGMGPQVTINGTGGPSGGSITPGASGAQNYTPTNTATFNPTNSASIPFATNSGAADNATLERGFNALYDVNNRGFSAVNSGISTLHNDLGGLANLLGGLTNGSSGGGGTDSNAIPAFHKDNTNLLGSIYGALTNRSGLTNPGDYLTGSSTNATAATTAANTAMAAPIGSLDGIIGGIGSAPDVGGGGGVPSMTIEFMGRSLDLSPEHMVPGICAWIKAWMTFIVILGYSLWLANLFWRCVGTMASARNTSTPDLEATVAGFGGNIAGAVVAVLIAVAFVALWVVVFNALFGMMGSNILSASSGAGLTGPVAAAWSLVCAVMPVTLILTLCWTRVILYFAMGKVVLVAVTASRFLIGG
ncbi:hypothetical protein [Staphylococcus aureus]|uniref:hypothetical protein n=1 Tax=Staphylococcus aureus TaxID=1280 RepID=UPI001581DCE5|nr:hypothetical protein [Staphylococcus aureus]